MASSTEDYSDSDPGVSSDTLTRKKYFTGTADHETLQMLLLTGARDQSIHF